MSQLLKRKKRIKVFVDGEVLAIDHFSGIGHYTADLLRAVDELLNEDEYSHFRIEIGVPRHKAHRLSRFDFKNFGVRNMPFSAHVATGLKKRHKLPPIDLLFGKKIYLFPNYSCWPTLFSVKIPIIYDLSFINHPEFVEPRNQKYLVDQVKLSVAKAKKIITISENSKKEIVKEFKTNDSDISIVYPAVDMHKFYKRSEKETKEIRAKYGIFDDYILFVGNIEPRKNLITLLNAYDDLPTEIQKKYALLLVGAKGWLDNEIRDKIISMRLRGIHILQPTDYVTDDDLPALYTGATAFAYVSRYEGFGIPPIEAMACGTPVISSDNSSLPEAVGKAAIKIKATDQKAIANAIKKIVSDKSVAKDLLPLGYEQIMKFDWKESAKILLKTIEEAAK